MRKIGFAFFLAAATAMFVAVPASATERLVTGGIVQGESLPDGSTVFRGLPYAAPPVGDLRWKPPAPVVPWQGVRDATKPPSPCLQHDEGWNAPDAAASKEDCLYLSIHSPKHRPGDRLPVMFWIHGGSNKAGSGMGYVNSAIHRHGVVLVSIEYRLGVFGFLASPELTAESPEHSSGNYALLDQIAALKWLKANIAQFGGDPGNVTIFGQSAGAQDVGMLLLSPLARGLFNKAIQESGTPTMARTAADNERIGSDFLKLMGAPANADGLKALRAASAEKLLVAGDKLVPPNNVDVSLIWLQAMVDGWVLPQTPAETFADGKQAHVPLIIGNNTREFPVEGTAEVARGIVRGVFGAHAEEALAFYGLAGTNSPPDDPVLGSATTQVLADMAFRCPSNRVAKLQLAAGLKVWRYQFGLGIPGSGKPVEHSAELKYVFDAPPPGATFATWPPVQEYWTNFAKTGNPNGPGLPSWPSLGRRANYIDFTPEGPKLGKDLRGPICRLLTAP